MVVFDIVELLYKYALSIVDAHIVERLVADKS
jgi:hypothetical protein